MSIIINVHLTHRQHTDNKKSVEVEGNTIGEALNDLCSKFPKIKNELFNKNGNLINHIEIYLNSESAYPDSLRKKPQMVILYILQQFSAEDNIRFFWL